MSRPPLRRLLGLSGGLALCGLAAGCGFHLAGERPLPQALGSVYIDLTDPYRVITPPLETALEARITARGGRVASEMEQAQSVLRLSGLSETREVLALGPDGKAIEYRLVTRVTFEMHSKGQELIPPTGQGISRDYSFSETAILANEAEEERLRNYMQNDLADLILLRIDAQLSHRGVSAPGATAVQ